METRVHLLQQDLPAYAPPFAEDALVLKLGDSQKIKTVVESYRNEATVIGGLGAMLRYVDQYGIIGTELSPIYPERSLGILSSETPFWRVAIPDWSSPRKALSSYHFLRLAPPALFSRENAELEVQLRGDPQIRLVYHPAIPYAFEPVESKQASQELSVFKSAKIPHPQWGLEKCEFPLAWRHLEQGSNPGPIGVIDLGGNVGHPELNGIKVIPPDTTATRLPHASAVCSVLAAPRDGVGMDGCCSARVHLHNVAPGDSFDKKAFIMALKSVQCKGLRVVNISIEMAEDHCVRDQIQECLADGMVVVAAMGNRGVSDPYYPAAYPGVIAVGAVNKSNRRISSSNTGSHIWLSAPGLGIHMVRNANTINANHSGTSYASAMVSAAAWLTLRARPHWTAAQVKAILGRSVHRVGRFDSEIGHGRLNMCKLVRELQCEELVPCVPEEA